MFLEDLNESDIETLRELLERSGRSAPERREALCLKIGINPTDISSIKNIPSSDFAVLLINNLLERQLEISVYKLCKEIKDDFKQGGYAPKLEAIIYKLNSNRNSEISEPISIIQPLKKDSHQLTQAISEKLVTEPESPASDKQVSQLCLNGLSLRKIFFVTLTVTGALIGLRFFGLLEWLELKTYDHLMQARLLNEKEDPRLLIVKITDEDIVAQDKRGEKGYGSSLRDPSLNRLLKTLQQHQPKLIGLDLYRAYPNDSSVLGLGEQLRQNNIVAVCKVPKTDEQGNQIGPEVAPPQEVNSFGFSDFITDSDNILRRHLMAQDQVPGTACKTMRSFSLLLARRYLEQELGKNINYIDPIISQDNLRFGKVVFSHLQPFTGGYQDVDNSGFQVLLNYRATTSGNVAKLMTLEEALNNKNPEDIRNKIVLIGSYAEQEGPRDDWFTPNGKMHGVTVHAHMISQILSAVLDGRPLLRVFPQRVEILWIWGWSFIGGVFAYYWRSVKPVVIAVSCGVGVLYVICWVSLTVASVWIPLIPPALALIGTSATVIYIASFSRTQHI
ncbi:CHASE2 domain-containing protein [Nostoc sp.]|uniref:CHASE2 domain-containing protein n=1 Tax=Nostoc sp. TaxID=1180 RepID=UPI002FFA892D